VSDRGDRGKKGREDRDCRAEGERVEGRRENRDTDRLSGAAMPLPASHAGHFKRSQPYFEKISEVNFWEM
jgi:hypothetical protein